MIYVTARASVCWGLLITSLMMPAIVRSESPYCDQPCVSTRDSCLRNVIRGNPRVRVEDTSCVARYYPCLLEQCIEKEETASVCGADCEPFAKTHCKALGHLPDFDSKQCLDLMAEYCGYSQAELCQGDEVACSLGKGIGDRVPVSAERACYHFRGEVIIRGTETIGQRTLNRFACQLDGGIRTLRPDKTCEKLYRVWQDYQKGVL